MFVPRFLPLAVCLSIAAALPAHADLGTTSFLPSTVQPSDLFGLPVDRWYVELNQTSAFTVIDSRTDTQGLLHVAPTSSQLDLSSESAQALLSRQAASRATTTATSIGTRAYAIDALDPHSSFTAAGSYAIMSYWAVLSDPTPVRFNFHLSGTLQVTGDRVGVDDGSSAAVAMFAQGSVSDPHPDYSRPFRNIGIDPYAEGEALLAQWNRWPTTTQTDLVTFGAQADTVRSSLSIDEKLQVTALGTKFDCNDAAVPACGRYFFFANVLLYTGARNGAVADFSHTLQVSGISTGSGALQPFQPGAISPVPEPASATLLGLGLVGLAVLARRRLAALAMPPQR